MVAVVFRVCFFVFFAADIFAQAYAREETVRSRAERRFSLFSWTQSEACDAADTPPGRIGNPLSARAGSAGASRDADQNASGLNAGDVAVAFSAASSLPAVYPEIPGAGRPVFSSAPDELLSLLSAAAAHIKAAAFSALQVCDGSEFLPVFLSYRLEKLPAVEDVYFPGVEVSEDHSAARSVFRLRFSSDSGSFASVFAVVEVARENGMWKIRDIIFDGDSYAEAVEQTGT